VMRLNVAAEDTGIRIRMIRRRIRKARRPRTELDRYM
jgi:hypothetical protein